MIVEKLVLGPFCSNCYIVGSEPDKEGMIIDPGDGARQILNRVSELGLNIKYIVLTHGHIDHFGAVKGVKEATGAKLALHANDAGFFREQQDAWLSMVLGISRGDCPALDWLLKGGEKLEIGNLQFLVLHTPGHTPGGICLWGQGVVFSGDTLFNGSVGRADLYGGSQSKLMDSLHTKLMVLADDTIVYPGHGPQTTIGNERRNNPFVRGF